MGPDASDKPNYKRGAGVLLQDSEVADFVHAQRAKGKTIALCHGVFDLLHTGHIDHLVEVADLADLVVVSVTSDEFVNKGPGRPVFGAAERAKMLTGIWCVDAVWISKAPTAEQGIALFQPNVFAKGPDYVKTNDDPTGNIEREIAAVEAIGGSIHFTRSAPLSSSAYINRAGIAHSEHLTAWLHAARDSDDFSGLDSWFARMKPLRVLVVGETIIDNYVFCEALGKTSKEPVLAFLRDSEERQVGGAFAIGRHLSGLGATVTLLSMVGADDAGEWLIELARDEASLNVELHVSSHYKTIEKTRFVEKSSGNKVFETYQMSDEPGGHDDRYLVAWLEQHRDSFDVIVVADYGHGLLTTALIEAIGQMHAFVCVNTQTNAGNRGFNSVSRYGRVDFVCLNGSELQLELRQRHISVKEWLPELATRTQASHVIVTDGENGVWVLTGSGEVQLVPAFTNTVLDLVGAGDALYAISSLLVHLGAPAEVIGFFGNLAGWVNVSDRGNRNTLSGPDLLRHAKVALK